MIALLGTYPATVAADAGCSLTIDASTFRSTKGGLVCRLFTSGEGFPGNPPYKATVRPSIAGKPATCAFHDVAPGTYAVALFHDENGNGKLEANFLGIPTEGVGVSNNKKPLIGPPSWEDAKFRLERDASMQVTLHY